MVRFLAEIYMPGLASLDPTEAIERLRAAADEMTAAGLTVRHVHSIVVPGDETIFHVLESHSARAVERSAGVPTTSSTALRRRSSQFTTKEE
jgi:hypothetical protein